jgi:hypothetical protein
MFCCNILAAVRMQMETGCPCHNFHCKLTVALCTESLRSLDAGTHGNTRFEALTAVAEGAGLV